MKPSPDTPIPTNAPCSAEPIARLAGFVAGTAVLLLTIGCTVGPRFKQPSLALQPYHNAPGIQARVDAPAFPARLSRK